MREHQFINIRSAAFDKIRKCSLEKRITKSEMDVLKQKQQKELKNFERFDETKDMVITLQYILERYNLKIKEKELENIEADRSILILQAYLNCVIAITNHDSKSYSECFDNYLKVIQATSIEKYNQDLQHIKQKRVTYRKQVSYLNSLNPVAKQAFIDKYDDLLTDDEINEDSVKQIDLEEEKYEFQQSYKKEYPEVVETDFTSGKLLSINPIEIAKMMYPELKDKMLELNEAKGKRTKAC